jgi:para-nitrobenzyl esterase
MFHGGGFVAGSSSEPRTDGEWFAKQGIVVVEPNYRLGVFGFLAHPELTKEVERSRLRQLRDARSGRGPAVGEAQRRRLRRRSGQRDHQRGSAGSLSVSALMASPLTRHLVHKAIGQSGAFFTSPTRGMAEKTVPEKERGRREVRGLGGAASLAELRAKPCGRAPGCGHEDRGLGLQPGRGQLLHAEKVAAVYAAGKQAKIPLLAGWTSRGDGDVDRDEPAEADRGDVPRQAQGAVQGPGGRRGQGLSGVHRRRSAAVGRRSRQRPLHLVFDVEVDRRAREERARLPLPLRSRAAGGERSNRFGAAHASDIEYSFNTLDSKKADWKPEDRETARVMAGFFANFVKTGNPNGPGLPPWPEFGKTHQVMVLDGASKVVPEPDRARYEFIDAYAVK